MRRFYKESNGAFLSVELDTNEYYLTNLNEDAFEGRACITYNPDPSYINTGTISREYLKTCTRINKSAVPKVWMERL